MPPAKPGAPFTKPTSGAGIALSADDVARLLSPQDSTQGRLDVAAKVAVNYNVQQFNSEEALVAEQVFRLLVRDTELSVRKLLSTTLKSSKKIPRDIVLTMAKDVAEVAAPVLKYSEVLTELDLVDIVHGTNDTERHIAIAERKHVSEKLADALLATDAVPVLTTLVKNEGALISTEAYGRIIERHQTQGAIMHLLAEREALPVTVAERLISVVSDKLGSVLQKKYRLAAEQLGPETEKTREDATLSLIRDNVTPEDMEKLITQLYAFGRLKPTLVLSALCQGQLLFFEMSVARLAGVPLDNARTLLNDRGELGFRALYNKSGLPLELVSAVRSLLAEARILSRDRDTPPGSLFAARLTERMILLSEEQEIPNLSFLLALTKKNT